MADYYVRTWSNNKPKKTTRATETTKQKQPKGDQTPMADYYLLHRAVNAIIPKRAALASPWSNRYMALLISITVLHDHTYYIYIYSVVFQICQEESETERTCMLLLFFQNRNHQLPALFLRDGRGRKATFLGCGKLYCK